MFTALFILDIFALVSLLATPFVLFASLFLNDSPHANQVVVGLLLIIFWSFPLTAALGGIRGLAASKTRDIRRMAIWTAIAYSSPVALVLVLAFARWL